MVTDYWLGTTSGAWATGANWNSTSAPSSDDVLHFHNSAEDLAGSDASATTGIDLHIWQSFTGTFGGDSGTYMQVDCDNVWIGERDYGSPTGSTQIWLNVGDQANSQTRVLRTATTGADTDLPPVLLKAAHAGADLFVESGKVGVAILPGETSTYGDITIGPNNQAEVYIGAGVTLTNLYVLGGKAILRCGATLVHVEGGECRTEGSGAITTASVYGGKLIANSTGTITTLNGYGGTADFTQSREPRTITTTDVWRGFAFKVDPAIVTLTNDPEPQEEMTLTTSAP